MFLEGKKSFRMARMGWVALATAKITVVIMVLLVASSGSAAHGPAEDVGGRYR